MARFPCACAVLLAGWPAAVRAHEGAGGRAAWIPDPWIALPLAAAALLYAAGVARLWRHAGRGRGIGARPVALFAAGWTGAALVLSTPLERLAQASFAAHMLQHEVLMVVAAPLLLLGRPVEAWTWALAPVWRRGIAALARAAWLRRTWTGATGPAAACGLHALAIWAWHVPAFFDAAIAHRGLHVAQHATFLVAALLFWASVGAGRPGRAPGWSMASLFATMVHTGALGALLTLAPAPWYGAYAAPGATGLAPLHDQQLGGLLMWVPGGVAYAAAALAIAASWIPGSAGGAPGAAVTAPALRRRTGG